MDIRKQPTSVTITFNPSEFWLRKCEDNFLGDFMLTHRIDMSYKGKEDQEGAPVLYLNEREAQLFRDAGFSEIMQPTMNQIPNIEETNTREIVDKLEKLESIILLRVDRLFFEGTVILLKDYKETLAQQIRAELHHQLQKAREEFKERIDGFLNGMKAEINISNEYKLGYRQALLDLKEAYHSELDQDVNK